MRLPMCLSAGRGAFFGAAFTAIPISPYTRLSSDLFFSQAGSA
jgi:hypothetical protein